MLTGEVVVIVLKCFIFICCKNHSLMEPHVTTLYIFFSSLTVVIFQTSMVELIWVK